MRASPLGRCPGAAREQARQRPFGRWWNRAATFCRPRSPSARPYLTTTYDEDAPDEVKGVGINLATGGPWRLPTTETTTAADGAGVDIPGPTIGTTSTTYTAQVPGTGDGWALGAPTRVTTGGITTVTVYDSAGRTTQTRQPMATGSDAGTTETVYYAADGSAADSRCDDGGHARLDFAW